jgi:glycosyltransferase involved in cell wall biosynthesis
VTRVLHVLSQRPSLTGSGVTLEALVRGASTAGMDQRVVIGVPATDPHPPVADLPPKHIHPLVFERANLDYPVPGMSDVMPYRSTVWSSMTADQLARYRTAWHAHLAPIIADFRPTVIHSHHIWLMSSLLKDIAPLTPVVTTCHATGLRQLLLAPHLAAEVRAGVRRNDRFLALHGGHARDLTAALDVGPERVSTVGAGYRREVFHSAGRTVGSRALAYAGKYSHAKGLPQLLDVLDRRPEWTLHVAGTGAGPQARALAARMSAMSNVVLHGMLDQSGLAGVLRQCDVFVLPSYYEGLPLVLVEALACGCRLVCTRLEGVARELAPALGEYLDLVDLPALDGPDRPVAADVPAFVRRLDAAIAGALGRPALSEAPTDALAPFTWRAVFARVADVWRAVAR